MKQLKEEQQKRENLQNVIRFKRKMQQKKKFQGKNASGIFMNQFPKAVIGVKQGE